MSMAGTKLTPEGWSGASKGVWSKQANRVIDRKGGITVVGADLIDALAGNDVVTGEQENGPGVVVPRKPRRGNLQLGGDADALTGTSIRGIGIDNGGFIFMGDGADTIVGSGADRAIRNRGFIFTQNGDDLVDVRQGGIRGKGFVDLGAGKDTFIGFGNHTVYGGGGRDTLLLPKGTYDFSRRNRNRYRLEKGGKELEIFDFEVIGAVNSSKSQRIEIDKGGTLVVKDNGSISLS
jgi:hypothetical protein